MPDAIIDLAINGRFLSQPTTGVQRVAREVTREIDRLLGDGGAPRFRVSLLCPEDADVSDLGLKHMTIEPVLGGGRNVRWEQVTLPRAVGGRYLLCLGNTAPLVSLLRSNRVAVMIHDLSYRYYPGVYRRRYRWFHAALLPLMLRRANPLITVSQTERAMLSQIAPGAATRIVIAQNGGWRLNVGNTGKIPPADALEPGYVLYVGSFSNRKNFEGVLKVAAQMVVQDGLRFVLVGATGSFLSPFPIDVPEAVRGSITMLGQIEDLAALEGIYRKAGCLIFPSFYEASPLPPLEAMHFGVPVVVSDIPAMRERCGDAGEYCDPHDIGSIVAGVRQVMTDPHRRAELIALGYARAQHWSWRAQARTILDAIMSHAGR